MNRERVTGWVLIGLLLPPLVWYGNPAVALCAGAALTGVLDRPLVPSGSRYGKWMLQAAIVLLGLRFAIDEVIAVSGDSIHLVISYVLIVFAAGFLGGALLGVDRTSRTLIAGGTAICGGTAIATLAPILRARPEQFAVAIAVVFLLNAVALLTFPSIGHWLALTQTEFGVWTALAIHDTSSIIATAALYGDEALEVATLVKLGRTLWLIPLAVVVSLAVAQSEAKVRVPGFILAFLAASLIATLLSVPGWITETATSVSKALLVCALFFVGTEMTRGTLVALRGRTAALAVVLWLLASVSTLLVVRATF